MDPWIRNEIGLKLVEVHVECTVESQRRCDGRNYLSNKAVEVSVCWPCDLKIGSGNIINGQSFAMNDLKNIYNSLKEHLIMCFYFPGREMDY